MPAGEVCRQTSVGQVRSALLGGPWGDWSPHERRSRDQGWAAVFSGDGAGGKTSTGMSAAAVAVTLRLAHRRAAMVQTR